MFSKKASIDVRKSTQKFLDSKRDVQTRFKHLKIVLGLFRLVLAYDFGIIVAHFRHLWCWISVQIDAIISHTFYQ